MSMGEGFRRDRAEQCRSRPGAATPRRHLEGVSSRRKGRGRPPSSKLERFLEEHTPSVCEVSDFKDAVRAFQDRTGELFLSPGQTLMILKSLGYGRVE